jgi:hypothetical protein
MEQMVEIRKTGDDSYHVFSDTTMLQLGEDVDGPKLMGMTWLTAAEVSQLIDAKPIGYKTSIRYRK